MCASMACSRVAPASTVFGIRAAKAGAAFKAPRLGRPPVLDPRATCRGAFTDAWPRTLGLPRPWQCMHSRPDRGMTTDEALDVLRGDDRYLDFVRFLARGEQAGPTAAPMPVALRKAKRALGTWRVVLAFLEDNLATVRWRGAPPGPSVWR